MISLPITRATAPARPRSRPCVPRGARREAALWRKGARRYSSIQMAFLDSIAGPSLRGGQVKVEQRVMRSTTFYGWIQP